MGELEKLAHEGGEDELDEPAFRVPKLLVEAVLALDPMQRASLGALIVGSLANELVEVQSLAAQLADGLKRQHKPARSGRTRTRS